MKQLLFLSLMLVSVSSFGFGQDYPITPDRQLTPGKLCDTPSGFRYPEKVAYCSRDVNYETKQMLIMKYDQTLGYHIRMMNRSEFKIDHFIPLCAGGSNDLQNLWPQHKSVYEVTDPVEPLLCRKMSEGKLSQAEAVKLIMRAKLDLNQVPAVMKILSGL